MQGHGLFNSEANKYINSEFPCYFEQETQLSILKGNMYKVRRRRPAGRQGVVTSATNDAPKFDIMDLSGCRPLTRRRAPFPPFFTLLPRALFDFSPGQRRLPPSRRGQGRPGPENVAFRHFFAAFPRLSPGETIANF